MKTFGKFLAVVAFAGAMIVAGKARAANETVTPTAVGCFEHGECFIVLAAPLVGSSSCVTDRTQIRWQSTQAGADAMYKTALAAYLSGRRLVVNPYSASCLSGFMKPWYLHIWN